MQYMYVCTSVQLQFIFNLLFNFILYVFAINKYLAVTYCINNKKACSKSFLATTNIRATSSISKPSANDLQRDTEGIGEGPSEQIKGS